MGELLRSIAWWYAVTAVVSTGGLVLMLWAYERRLAQRRAFSLTERIVYRACRWIDRLYNILYMSALFLESPYSINETASGRFMRHRHRSGYRGFTARFCWAVFIAPVAPQHDKTMMKRFLHED